MIKQVIVVRKDLNMRKGKMCAQAAHASMKIFCDRIIGVDDDNMTLIISPLKDEVFDWIDNSFTKIVVGCNSLDDILEIEAKCKSNNIIYATVTDNGATEFNGIKTITCIAVGPDEASKIDLITGHYQLL